MRIIEKLTSRFRRKERKIVTTHTLAKYILETKTIPTPIYRESREYIKERKRIQHEVRKHFER